TCLAYVRYASKPDWRTYLPVPVLLILGLMTKPAVVTLPFALLLLDFWPLRRTSLAAPRQPAASPDLAIRAPKPLDAVSRDKAAFPQVPLRTALLEKAPLLLLSLVAAIVTMLSERGSGLHLTFAMPLTWRIGNAIVSYCKYLQDVLFPSGLAI